MTDKKISKKGILEIASYEGFSATKYLDSVGVQTIGFGFTKSDIPDLAQWGWDRAIDLQYACQLFKNHLEKYEKAVRQAIIVEIAQNEFDACVSLCYNIGCGGFARSTLARRINAQKPVADLRAAIMMWNKPKEILGRRKKEADLFCENHYTNDGKCDIIQVSSITRKPKYHGRISIAQFF